MSIQKLHYENLGGMLIRREGLLTWRCPLCKAEGQSPEVMRTCPECGSKETTLPGAQPAPSFADAYQGAMDEVAIWKKRALEAEDLNRKFVAEINGPTYMGEPAQPAPSGPDLLESLRCACNYIDKLGGVSQQYRAVLASPEANPAPSEQDESVRKAWARFSHELRRSPDAPYPGMADAFEQHFSQSFVDREWRAEAATWAAAWKAAKRHGA